MSEQTGIADEKAPLAFGVVSIVTAAVPYAMYGTLEIVNARSESSDPGLVVILIFFAFLALPPVCVLVSLASGALALRAAVRHGRAAPWRLLAALGVAGILASACLLYVWIAWLRH